jgi:subtilisin family serine protease
VKKRTRTSPRLPTVILVAAVAGTACSGDSETTEPEVRAVAMTPVGSTVFTGTAGGLVPGSPTVVVMGSNGQPFSGATVTFSVSSGGGQVTGGTATSTGNGTASPGGWTLGQATGTNTITATSGSLPSVTFTAVGKAGAPASLTVVSGNAQSAGVGSAVPSPLTVLVADQFGNPVPDATVTFTVTSGGGQLVGATATTNVQGQASAGGWILGGTMGAQSVSATVAAVAPVAFTATAMAGAAAKLAIASGDAQTGDLNGALGNPLSVRVTDAFGNGVANVAVSFNVSSGSATLSTATATSNAQGLANANLTLTDVGVSTVTATAASIPGARAVFAASTGPTLLGEVTFGPRFQRPFAGTAQAARMSAKVATGQARQAPAIGSEPMTNALSAKEAARRIITRGRLIVSYKPQAFSLPTSALAYRSAAPRQQATDAYLAALAPYESSGLIHRREVSPAIAAVRVEVADGQRQEDVMAVLRQDPRVLAVEEEQVRYLLDAPPDEHQVGFARFVADMAPSLFTAPATEVYAGDPFSEDQLWMYNMIDLPRAWRLGTGSSQVRVAVIDNGLRADHPDISGNAPVGAGHFDFLDGTTNAFGTQTICATGATFNTVRGPAADLNLQRGMAQHPTDLFLAQGSNCWSRHSRGSHGTHVAGTIGARSNNGLGGTGVNWDVTLIMVRVLGVTGAGWDFDIAQGILYAAGLPATYTGAPPGFTVQMAPAHVANLSLGGPAPSVVTQNAVAAASLTTLLVCAAGNSSDSEPNYPAAFPGCLSVVALAPDYGLASYTTVGTTVDIAAPGGDHRFTAAGVDALAAGTAGVLSTTWNFQTGLPNLSYYNGTSMAAPHVSGVAALVKAANPGFTAAQLRAAIENGAIDMGSPGRDDRFGAGVVNAFNAVTGLSGPASTSVVRAVSANTGAVARTATLNGNGRFTFANLAAGDYFVVAGSDESADGLFGFPGRPFNWFGSSGMTAVQMSGTLVRSLGLTLSPPMEVEPNNTMAQARSLVVNSWVNGAVFPPDTRDTYAVMIPTAGTYTFETSGAVGSCGYALDLDTVLLLRNQSGQLVASNDDTAYPVASYPGRFCSRISVALQPGLHYVEVNPFDSNARGGYRLHVRSGN